MDHFEKELARMMRDTQGSAPFEIRHRQRLRAAVRSRRRTRAAWTAAGSALAATGLGVGLVTLPSAFADNAPTGREHRPASTRTTAPGPIQPSPATPHPMPSPSPTLSKPESAPTSSSDPSAAATDPAPTQTPGTGRTQGG